MFLSCSASLISKHAGKAPLRCASFVSFSARVIARHHHVSRKLQQRDLFNCAESAFASMSSSDGLLIDSLLCDVLHTEHQPARVFTANDLLHQVGSLPTSFIRYCFRASAQPLEHIGLHARQRTSDCANPPIVESNSIDTRRDIDSILDERCRSTKCLKLS